MRLAFLASVAFLALTGCTVTESTSTDRPGPTVGYATATKAPTADHPTVSAPSVAAPVVAQKGDFAEVVYVLMRDFDRGQWFCTGTLVDATTVVTAAHCLDTALFVSYQIVAPLAKNSPRVAASKPKSFSDDYGNVANPDIGILKLEKPILLDAYAELTDVTERVAAGEKIVAAAVVRTAEKPEAALHVAQDVEVISTVDLGYEHGFGTPLFTNGGDSGAGLFLVENGKRSHKLIGVARQPEPARSLDHFTRIDAGFLDWFAVSSLVPAP